MDLNLRRGYQFDIAKGDVNWYGEKISENELRALLFQVGMLFNF